MSNPVTSLIAGFLRGLADGMLAEDTAPVTAPVTIHIENVHITEAADLQALVATVRGELAAATAAPAKRLPWKGAR